MSNFTSPGQESGHWQACCDAIENTAARLGVDPVALAEACQDGEALADALAFTAVNTLTKSQQARRLEIFAMLAALKRAEPKP